MDRERFTLAAAEAATKEQRQTAWWVYSRYEVKHTVSGVPYVQAAWDSLDSYDLYFPLVSYPTLFLKFARLAEEGEITQEVWLEWISSYGVLGLQQGASLEEIEERHEALGLGKDFTLHELKQIGAMEIPYGIPVHRYEGGPAETYRRFVAEAVRANRILNAYEAVTRDKPDVGLITRYTKRYPGTPFSTLDDAVYFGVGWVALYIDRVLATESYTRIYFGEDEPFSLEYGFHGLLGAMYLQMAWLAVAKNEVRCKQCSRVIDYEQPEIPWERLLKQKGLRKPYKTRSDKEFCSKSCANKWYYEHVRKPRQIHQ